MLGERYYQQKLATYHRRIGNRRDFNPLNVVAVSEPLRELQHYVYVPLVLTALEREIGVAQVWKWLSMVLRSGVSETAYRAFEEKYVLPKKAVESVLNATK